MRFGWPPHISAAQRRYMAQRELEKLVKKGFVANPIVIEGKKIAKTFWGKAWCENLESYSDYENRLPRGRTYLRNGSVCHLEIGKGEIKARVSGSALYTVTIGIKPLGDKAWKAIKDRCTGKIASLLDLLAGRLDDGVMEIVTDRQNGLFPKPSQISLNCSCPDWASMCKHVAAVLYGVGARLDEQPELLFLLRGVNHMDLVSATIEDAVTAVVKGGSRKRIAESDLSEVFGVDVDVSSAPRAGKTVNRGSGKTATPTGKVIKHTQAVALPFPKRITGTHVRGLRDRLGLTGKDFATFLGVSGGAVSVWERSKVALNLQDRTRKALEKAWKKGQKQKNAGPGGK
jgi:uncharacterized Zn finger protein/DNA-binding transcriptional regulator YiaG